MTKDSDKLAQKLRKVYQFERARYELIAHPKAEPYRLPVWWNVHRAACRETSKASIWRRLAQACKRRNVDATKFLQWSLSIIHLLFSGAPEPSELLQRSLFDEYLEKRPRNLGRLQQQMSSEARWFAGQVAVDLSSGRSIEDAVRYAFSLVEAPLSPLLQYVVALRLGNKYLEIALEFETLALLQYQYFPEEYDKVFGELIPPSFPERAVLTYEARIDEYDLREGDS